MIYTYELYYPGEDNSRAKTVIHIEGNSLAEIMANAKKSVAMINGGKLGACIPGAHTSFTKK